MSIIVDLTHEQQIAIAAEYSKLDAMAEAQAPGMMVAQVFGNHMKVGVIDGQKARALQVAFGVEHAGKTVRTAYDDPANVELRGAERASLAERPSPTLGSAAEGG